jgi:hypothetical protein
LNSRRRWHSKLGVWRLYARSWLGFKGRSFGFRGLGFYNSVSRAFGVSSTIAVENRGFPSDQFGVFRGLAWLFQVLSLDPCCSSKSFQPNWRHARLAWYSHIACAASLILALPATTAYFAVPPCRRLLLPKWPDIPCSAAPLVLLRCLDRPSNPGSSSSFT